MARENKPVHRVQMTDGKRKIIRQFINKYNIESALDIQEALKDLLCGRFKEMMNAQMDDHFGYNESERFNNGDYCKGYKIKQVNSSYIRMKINVS